MYLRNGQGLGQTTVTTIPSGDTIKPAAARLTGFEKNSAKLKDFHAPDIDRVAEMIAASWATGQPIHTVYVKGHSSSEGPAQYNIGLGTHRALAVRKALQKAMERKQKNLSYKVLVLAQSKGSKEPIDTNETEEGKSQNRRVEVFLSTTKLKPLPKKHQVITLPEQVITGTLTPLPTAPQSCNKELLRKKVDECIAQTRACVALATALLLAGLARCKGNALCNAAVTANFYRAVSACRKTLLACDTEAKGTTGCS